MYITGNNHWLVLTRPIVAGFNPPRDNATKSFDETMAKAVSAEKLGKIWEDMKGAGGKYKEISGNIQIKQVSPFTAVYVPTVWEKKQMDVKVIFSKDRRISGLWIVSPGED